MDYDVRRGHIVRPQQDTVHDPSDVNLRKLHPQPFKDGGRPKESDVSTCLSHNPARLTSQVKGKMCPVVPRSREPWPGDAGLASVAARGQPDMAAPQPQFHQEGESPSRGAPVACGRLESGRARQTHPEEGGPAAFLD